jgi:hypothetical protein
MSNATIIQQMRAACDQWDNGQINCLTLGKQIVGLASSLEGLSRGVIDECRTWETELILASDDANFGERERALAQVCGVVSRIRVWIDRLETAPGGHAR